MPRDTRKEQPAERKAEVQATDSSVCFFHPPKVALPHWRSDAPSTRSRETPMVGERLPASVTRVREGESVLGTREREGEPEGGRAMSGECRLWAGLLLWPALRWCSTSASRMVLGWGRGRRPHGVCVCEGGGGGWRVVRGEMCVFGTACKAPGLVPRFGS